MLVANSFDLWRKDAFFSAAEEVQQSADIMESTYRAWLSTRREGLLPQHLDELGRELQMALGTAKWQLEEFERAVRLSHRSNGDDGTITRHKQFVSAIEDQISHVETALKESFTNEGKKPFRWVNLDEEDCDDLALFISGTSETSQRINDERIKLKVKAQATSPLTTKEDHCVGSKDDSIVRTMIEGKSSEGLLTNNEEASCFKELEENSFPDAGNEIGYQVDQIASHQRTWSSPSRRPLEIVIDSADRQNNALSEVTPKEKGVKPFFWRSGGEDYPGIKGVLNGTQLKTIINQHLRGGERSQRQQQVLPVLPLKSIRFILPLMLTIFLVVPFLMYST